MNWIALPDGELNDSKMEVFLETMNKMIVPKQE
jgi:hypothetical protein